MVAPDRGSSPTSPNATPSAWVKLAYDAGIETLKAQRDELNGIRTRAIALTAMIVAATAFLVGQGLGATTTRDVAFYIWAVIGTTGFLALAVCIVFVVGPSLKFRFLLDPGVLMGWIADSGGTRTEEMALRRLAMNVLPEMIEENEGSLQRVRRRYWFTLVTAILTLAVWVVVVWVFA